MEQSVSESKREGRNEPQLHWRERPFLPLSLASEILCVAESSLRRMEAKGELRFKRIGGRTLVYVEGIIRIVDAEDAWAPDAERGEAARARRKEIAQRAWR